MIVLCSRGDADIVTDDVSERDEGGGGWHRVGVGVIMRCRGNEEKGRDAKFVSVIDLGDRRIGDNTRPDSV